MTREEAIKMLKSKMDGTVDTSYEWAETVRMAIEALHKTEAQTDTDEWCTDCKEYDHERHCCPRWNRVIRETLKDMQIEKRTEESTKTHACDCISRRKAFEYFVTLWECIGTIMDRDEWEDVCMTTANEIPSAQSDRKTGRWVSVGCVVPDIANAPMIKCTVCGHLEPDVDAARTPYCSHCGAFMGATGGDSND